MVAMVTKTLNGSRS